MPNSANGSHRGAESEQPAFYTEDSDIDLIVTSHHGTNSIDYQQMAELLEVQ